MNSLPRYYTESDITKMNTTYPWNGTLTCDPNNKSKSGLYEYHATGDADLNGRKYIALPKETKITEEVKRKYNLM